MITIREFEWIFPKNHAKNKTGKEMLIDLYCHAEFSKDNCLEPKELIEKTKDLHLDAVEAKKSILAKGHEVKPPTAPK